MNIKEFAEDAGVTIGRCEPDWGGTYSYKSEDYPNSTVCGFRSEAAAYKGWMEDSFGKKTTKALLRLLKK
jgi:hypothetical protein